jgi:hypothetical protein
MNLLVTTFSAVGNFERRQAIRATWGNITHFTGMRIAFVIGQTLDTKLARKVTEESEMYNDLVQTNVIDSWRNLTLKHMAMLDFIVHQCPNVPIVLKTDDDVYLSMPKVMKFVHSIQGKRNSIYGDVFYNTPVGREPSSKYYVSWEAYGKPLFPPFCVGTAYIMTSDVVSKLLAASLKKLCPESSEDAFVTGIVAEELGIERVNMNPFTHHRKYLTPASSQLTGDFGVGNVEAMFIRQIWRFDLPH